MLAKFFRIERRYELLDQFDHPGRILLLLDFMRHVAPALRWRAEYVLHSTRGTHAFLLLTRRQLDGNLLYRLNRNPLKIILRCSHRVSLAQHLDRTIRLRIRGISFEPFLPRP